MAAPAPSCTVLPRPVSPEDAPSPEPRREAPPAFPAPLTMRAGLSAEEVGRHLARAARHEETGRRVLAFYLVEMDARRLYQATGHGSTAHYAEAQLGLDRRRVAELLRVGAQLLELRELDRAFCDGRLGWAKVLVVARMATPEHERAWLAQALALDVRALSLLAARSKEGGPPRTAGDEKGLPEIRFPVAASVSPLVFAKLEQAQRRLGAELGHEIDVAGLLDTLLDQFLATEADGSVPGRKPVDASAFHVQLIDGGVRGAPLRVITEEGEIPVDQGGAGTPGAVSEAVRCDAGVRNHHVPGSIDPDHRARDVKTPPRLRRRVLRRDGRRCRSCRSRWSLMVHHIEFRAHGGKTRFENLITLCSRCHGLVHAGLLLIEGPAAETARFVDASGRPLSATEDGRALASAAGRDAPGYGEGLSIAPPDPEQNGSGVVTIQALPSEVDGTWWRRHAHLVVDRGDVGNLRFRSGTPAEPFPPPVDAPGDAAAAFAGLVGQDERVARLRRVARGARARGGRFPHVLISGPAGTGKTTLARGIAAVAGQPLAVVSAPLVCDRATWIRLLAGLEEDSLLFVDEAHALPRALFDVLLEALSERRLSLVLSDGVSARHVTLRLPAFTLVMATTNEGAIPPALRGRFGLRETLTPYDPGALSELVSRAAAREGVAATARGALRLAGASRGTPREALRLLERTLDDGALDGIRCLDEPGVERVLAGLGYDAEGLDQAEQRYLQVLRESPVPVPLSRLSRLLGTSAQTLIEHIEPWLFARGLVRMTSSGREATRGPRHRARGQDDAPNVRQRAPDSAGEG